MNLKCIPDLNECFNLPTGLSDHTLSPYVPVAATALGACIIEKHFIKSREDGGPDSGFSLEPAEFRQMVDAVRVTEAALGTASYHPSEKEEASKVFRRSLYAVADIEAGTRFTDANIRSIRPGYGLPPSDLPKFLGKIAQSKIERGTPLISSHIPAE